MASLNFYTIKTFVSRSGSDLAHAMYPNFCLLCDSETPHSPESVCPVCQSELQYTYYEDFTGPTALDKMFWGRLQLEKAYAMLHFDQATSTQSILHSLKYKDRPDVAHHYGSELGRRIAAMEVFHDLSALVPVPLHPRKEFLRGYNQSAKLAEGISAVTNTPVDNELLRRIAFTESQTKKNKASRWENMQERFQGKSTRKSYRHIAIVDDVVTTGSTIEMCAGELKRLLPDCRISVISLAVAR